MPSPSRLPCTKCGQPATLEWAKKRGWCWKCYADHAYDRRQVGRGRAHKVPKRHELPQQATQVCTNRAGRQKAGSIGNDTLHKK